MEHKVLVLDDESDACMLMRIILESRGYRVFTKQRGEEALVLLGEEQVDVALVDMRMPGMDGPRFLAELERLPEEKRPVVLVSSAGRPDEVRKELDGLEVFDILEKPFEVPEVEARIERAVEECRRRRDDQGAAGHQ